MKESDVIQIAELVYRGSGVSRSGLAERTKLAPSYISTLVRYLRTKGLIIEGGHAPSRGGRRRILLYANPECAHLIGIDLGTRFTRIIVTDCQARVLTSRRFPSGLSNGKDHVLNQIHEGIERALESDKTIRGIGVGVSGVIDRNAGILLFWPKISGWENVPVKEELENRHHLPVVVEDSVRTMALAEQRFGYAKGISDFVYVSVGMGVGSAVFVNGEMYFGHDGLAGELGHTTIDETGEPCSCGNRGCLEVYASGSAIINRVRVALQHGVTSSLMSLAKKGPDRVSVEAIVTAAKNRDRLSQRVLSEAGGHLGTGLATIVNLLNPEKIILGGAVSRATKALTFRSLLLSLNERTFNRSVRHLKLAVSRLDDNAGAIGAALMIGEQVMVRLARAGFSNETDPGAGKVPISDAVK